MNIAVFLKAKELVGGGLQFQTVRRSFYAKGIKTSYEPYEGEHHSANESDYEDPNVIVGGHDTEEGKKSKRMIFSLTGNADKSGNAYVHGLILDRKNWECVVMPPPYFESNPVAAIVNQGLADQMYDIIPVRDGTLMNLYYWNECGWCIGTTKGYDMTDAPFIHLQKTYRQILTEVLATYELTFDNFTTFLNKDYSYSFVVTHSDIHLYWKTRDPHHQLCFIQKALRSTGDISHVFDECKLPVQTPVEMDTRNMCLEDLHKLPNETFPFGVILRSKDSRIRKMAHIIIESPLFNNIKNLVYNYWINKEITPDFDRESYIILRAYLSKTHHVIFKEIFPQYTNVYDMITTKIGDLLEAVYALYGKSALPDNITTKYARIVQSYLKKVITITSAKKKIIQSYVLHPDMTVTLYPFIFGDA